MSQLGLRLRPTFRPWHGKILIPRPRAVVSMQAQNSEELISKQQRDRRQYQLRGLHVLKLAINAIERRNRPRGMKDEENGGEGQY